MPTETCTAYNDTLRLRCDYPAGHVTRHHGQIDSRGVHAWGFTCDPSPVTTTPSPATTTWVQPGMDA